MTQTPQGNNDSGIDTIVDKALNEGIDSAANRVPEGQKFDEAAKQKADQAANNALNQELNKGIGSIEKDVRDRL